MRTASPARPWPTPWPNLALLTPRCKFGVSPRSLAKWCLAAFSKCWADSPYPPRSRDRAVAEQAGIRALNVVWRDAESLPTSQELDDPEGWIERTGAGSRTRRLLARLA
jgi:hypothetical protein